MKRRIFLQSLAAAGMAPALPSISLSAPAAAPFTPYMYGLGLHWGRVAGSVSPELLMTKLRIPAATAQAMQAQMVASGAVAQGAGGVLATQPYMSGRLASPANSALRPTLRKARDWARSAESIEQPRPDATPDSADQETRSIS